MARRRSRHRHGSSFYKRPARQFLAVCADCHCEVLLPVKPPLGVSLRCVECATTQRRSETAAEKS
jgi:hypothetical protein